MKKADWRPLVLDDGILREPTPDPSRIVLWLPSEVADGVRYWKRLGNVPGARIVVEHGLCMTAATALPAKQQGGGLLGKVFGWLRRPKGEHAWLLPSGGYAVQAGERQNDLVLVWPETETLILDEAKLQERWPQARNVRRLGKNFFCIEGAETPAPTLVAPGDGDPRQEAERLLAAARKAGNRRAEIAALTDLGIVHTRSNDIPAASAALEEAWELSRHLGDPAVECDVLLYFAQAVLATGQPDRAKALLDPVFLHAHKTGNRFLEKSALGSLGMVQSALRDYPAALHAGIQALAIAQAVGDRHHQAELFWFLAIQHAELGQRDQAIARAQASIDLHEGMKHPSAPTLVEHLRRYRDGKALGRIAPPSGPPAGGYYTGPTSATDTMIQDPAQQTMGPGVLKMALSAARAVGKYLGSGMKTVPVPIREQRLEKCNTCEHHTGVRCKLCGCFTSLKTWLPHENCPVGKW